MAADSKNDQNAVKLLSNLPRGTEQQVHFQQAEGQHCGPTS